MEWRIEQANCDRQSSHFTKDAAKVSALERQQFLQGFFSGAGAVRQNHFAHRCESLIAEEHVLGATEANSFRAELSRHFGIAWCVSICANAKFAKLVSPAHQLVKVGTQRRLHGGNLSQEDPARRTINRNPVALGYNGAVDGELLLPVVDLQCVGAADARLAHAPRHYRGVTGHATPRRHDRLRGNHAMKIVRTSFLAHQNEFGALAREFLRFVGTENYL